MSPNPNTSGERAGESMSIGIVGLCMAISIATAAEGFRAIGAMMASWSDISCRYGDSL